jgi:glucosamine--fructose-6-phosphate aminotransferase (isomerizing)
MLNEIKQQPEVVLSQMECNLAPARRLVDEIKKRDIGTVILAARGTSDNAATFGKYLLELINGAPACLAAPSIVTLYGARLRLDRALVIGVSQSGKAVDVVEYLKGAREMGALTAAITNEQDSDLACAAEHTLLCCAGVERSVAATKTYTATLGAFYVLSSVWADRPDMLDGLRKTTELMHDTLSLDERLAAMAERYRFMQECFVISRGLNHATAAETALKMAETSYVGAKPYSAADFLHGPIAVVDEGFPCFLLAAEGQAFDAMMDASERLRAKKAETIVFSSATEILKKASIPVRMPVTVDELFSPLVYIIPGQLLAYHLATTKSHDPDHPRGLSKVTLTR